MEIINCSIKSRKLAFFVWVLALCSLEVLNAGHTTVKFTPKQLIANRAKIARTQAKLKSSEIARVFEAAIKDAGAKDCKDGEFFVYQEGTTDGTCVPLNVLKLSQVMTDMFEDFGQSNDQRFIPLPYPIDIIKDSFLLLQLNSDEFSAKISNYSLDKLAKIVKIFDNLDVKNEFKNKALNVFAEKIIIILKNLHDEFDVAYAKVMGQKGTKIKDYAATPVPDYSALRDFNASIILQNDRAKQQFEMMGNDLKHYMTQYYDKVLGEPYFGSAMGKAIILRHKFMDANSIAGKLDVVKKCIEELQNSETYEQKQAKLWFWQKRGFWGD